MTTETWIAESEEEWIAFAAELLGRAISDAARERGVARVALSGGSTPGPVYRKLRDFVFPWSKIAWFQVDERAVPPEHARSNFRAMRADIGDAMNEGRVFRMEAEAADLRGAADRYEKALRDEFGVASSAAFDVLVAGIGDDGHTASLFPRMGSVAVTDRLVLAVPAQPDKGLEPRLTLSAPAMCEARQVLVLAKGANKLEVVEQARSPGSEDEIPSRLFQRAKGHVVWVLDKAAAP